MRGLSFLTYTLHADILFLKNWGGVSNQRNNEVTQSHFWAEGQVVPPGPAEKTGWDSDSLAVSSKRNKMEHGLDL